MDAYLKEEEKRATEYIMQKSILDRQIWDTGCNCTGPLIPQERKRGGNLKRFKTCSICGIKSGSVWSVK